AAVQDRGRPSRASQDRLAAGGSVRNVLEIRGSPPGHYPLPTPCSRTRPEFAAPPAAPRCCLPPAESSRPRAWENRWTRGAGLLAVHPLGESSLSLACRGPARCPHGSCPHCL